MSTNVPKQPTIPPMPEKIKTHMSDLIDRQAAIDALYHVDEYNARSVKAIRNLPAAEPERKTGQWIDITKTGGDFIWKCSECGELNLEDTYFCPNCGCKMEVEHEEKNA